MFDTVIYTKMLRINPLTWNLQIMLKIDLIGCPVVSGEL